VYAEELSFLILMFTDHKTLNHSKRLLGTKCSECPLLFFSAFYIFPPSLPLSLPKPLPLRSIIVKPKFITQKKKGETKMKKEGNNRQKERNVIFL